jgi:phospholipid transport system substrate-binding protein
MKNNASQLTRIFLILAALHSVPPAISAVEPSTKADTPQAVVETIITNARNLNQKSDFQDRTRTIESLVDFQTICDRALAKNLKTLSAEHKTEISSLLKTILTKTVYPAAPQFFKDVSVQFKPAEDTASGKARIKSLVSKGKSRSSVEYWLESSSSGYRVVDLAIDGESWVKNVGGQFDQILSSKGPEELIRRMKKRLAQIEAQTKNS